MKILSLSFLSLLLLLLQLATVMDDRTKSTMNALPDRRAAEQIGWGSSVPGREGRELGEREEEEGR